MKSLKIVVIIAFGAVSLISCVEDESNIEQENQLWEQVSTQDTGDEDEQVDEKD